MKTIHRYSALTIAAVLCFAGCPNQAPKTVIGGGGTGSGSGAEEFWISSGNLVVEEGRQPAVVFNLLKTPGEEPSVVYALILKYPGSPESSSHQYSSGATNDGVTGVSTGTITINGKKLPVEYRATVEGGKLKEESLEIDGEDRPLDKGRVFLVDLTADPISVVQHDLKLPSDLPSIPTLAETEALADRIVSEIDKESLVSKFVE